MEKKRINLFQDKEYEELDWLNKAVEPYVFPLSDVFANIPDVTEFGFEEMCGMMKEQHSQSLSRSYLVNSVLTQVKLSLTQEDLRFVSDNMEVYIPHDLNVNFEQSTMDGVIQVRKLKHQFDDNDIKEYINHQGGYILTLMDPKDTSRQNEILDIFGDKDNLSSRSVKKKQRAIYACYRHIIVEDTWRIRDAALAIRCASWIVDYVNNGNLASLSNFTRMKCMTYKGLSIYSMEETV